MYLGSSQKYVYPLFLRRLNRLSGRLDVFFEASGEAADGRTFYLLRYQPDRLEIARRRDRKSRLYDVDVQADELPGYLQFLVRFQARSGRLLSVAQCRIKYYYFIHGIICLSFFPTTSIRCSASRFISLSKFFLPVSFSAIHSFANSPDWISFNIFFISARADFGTTLSPRVRSPYLAVSETRCLIPCIPLA